MLTSPPDISPSPPDVLTPTETPVLTSTPDPCADDDCDADGVTAGDGDCNDGNAAVYPGANEICDGEDNDRNGIVDDVEASSIPDGDTMYQLLGDQFIHASSYATMAFALAVPSLNSECCLPTTYYADQDGDGYGDPTQPTPGCGDVPEGYADNHDDCYDSDAAVNPEGQEVCGGGDEDCDGQSDDADDSARGQSTWYSDANGDGYGDLETTTRACAQPSGYVANHNDCDDLDEAINPGAKSCDDLNGDGYADIIVPNAYNGPGDQINSFIYWGSSAGISDTNRTDLPTKGAQKACVADVNNDGYKDIVFANYFDGTSYSTTSYVYWGSASRYSASSRTELNTVGASDCEVNDFDNDGDADIAFANQYNGISGEIDSFVYWNDGGSFDNQTDLLTESAAALTSEDLNGDKCPELIFANLGMGIAGYVDSGVESRIYWGSKDGNVSPILTHYPPTAL